MLTHGEAYMHRRINLDFSNDIDKILRNFERLPKRMTRSSAIIYYNAKLRKVFGIEEVSNRDFRKVEEYFDYHEANKLLKQGF